MWKSTLIIILISSGCISSNRIYGIYQGRFGSDFEQITLKEDNSFEYQINLHLCESKTFFGTWEKSATKLILYNSDSKQKVSEVRVQERNDESINGSRIKLTFEGDTSVFTKSFYLNNSKDPISIDNNILEVDFPVRKFTISTIEYGDFEYEVKNRKNNSLYLDLPYRQGIPCDNLTPPNEFKIRKDKLLHYSHVLEKKANKM